MIYLVRHGETESNKKGILQDQLTSELSDLGVEQTEKLANRLKNFNFSKIISSDSKRAIDTAKIINTFHQTNISLDKRLRERNYGNFVGHNPSIINTLKGGRWERSPPNGESINMQLQRVKSFLGDFNVEGDVLIVSHSGTIKALIHFLLNEDLEKVASRKNAENTSLYVLEKLEDRYKIVLENCNKHLRQV